MRIFILNILVVLLGRIGYIVGKLFDRIGTEQHRVMIMGFRIEEKKYEREMKKSKTRTQA